jgi:DNA primase
LFFVYEDTEIAPHTLRPRFRGRLMIPIRDHQGRVCAFTARQTERTPDDDPAREAKYVNSPETPVFSKGNLLFNLDRARTAVGDGKPFVMVEGQLDALRCWSVGVKTAIAPQGTSITESQLVLLRRYHAQVECFFDSDGAGQKAALRFLPMALKAGLEIRFLTLAGETKLDPDLLFLESGPERATEVYRGLVRNSAMAFACRAALPDLAGASAEAKSRAAQTVFEIIAQAESEVARSEFVGEVATHLRLASAALVRDFQAFVSRANRQAAARPPPPDAPPPPVENAPSTQTPEHHLLLLLLHFEALGPPLGEALPHEWIDTAHAAGVLLNRFLNEFAHGEWPGRDHLERLLETDAERALVATLLFEAPVLDDPAKVAGEAVRLLRARALEPQLREIELALANPAADIESDPISLLKTRSALHLRLRQPIVLRLAE